jgi:hypothetical protein
LVNLRGVKEAGILFAVPTYGFVAMVYLMLGLGFVRCLSECPQAATANLPLEAAGPLSLFLVLKAFSSGATALTGVEAVSNGVPAFRRPQAKNAATTLAMMAVMTVTMFLGITVLTVLLHVRVNHEIAASRSVLSQIGETVFGRTFPYFVLQGLTAGILILAANTSYQDFPRLSSILARDRFMPSQFRNRGDRLVFSNGIIILSVAASLLVYAFDADLTRLIQLYVVGVFTAFTLSQTGMVRRWLRLKEPGWRRSMIVNAIGAMATGVVLVIVTVTKFSGGAWIVLAAMPVIIGFFIVVHRHYEWVGRALRLEMHPPTPDAENTFVLLVRDLGPATAKAVGYIRTLRPERVVPLFVGDPATFEEVAEGWPGFAPRLGSLQQLRVEEGRPTKALRARLRSIRRDGEGFVTVVVPEALTGRSLLRNLGRRWGFWLKVWLFFEVGIVVTDVPLLPEERASMSARPVEPIRHVVLIPVSSVHAAAVSAVSYALSLEAAEIEAVYLSTDRGDERELAGAWIDWRMGIPLAIVDAPFRDLSEPMLEEVRRHTAREGTIVTVVLPELVVAHWWEQLLHSQSALFFKRLLLFEPGVVVTSVPFHIAQVTERPPTVSVPAVRAPH